MKATETNCAKETEMPVAEEIEMLLYGRARDVIVLYQRAAGLTGRGDAIHLFIAEASKREPSAEHLVRMSQIRAELGPR